MLPDRETTQDSLAPDALLGVPPAKRRGGRPKGSFKKPPAPGDAPKESRRDPRRRLEQKILSPVMSVEETALYMRVSEQTIYDDANAGKLPHIRKGKRILIVKPLLDEMIFNEARDRSAPPKEDASEHPPCPHCGCSGSIDAAVEILESES